MDHPELGPNNDLMMMAIQEERKAQLRVWGHQTHPDGTGSVAASLVAEHWKRICDSKHSDDKDDFLTIAMEEVMEAAAEEDKQKLLNEVIQAAAVFTAWGEKLLEERKRGEW